MRELLELSIPLLIVPIGPSGCGKSTLYDHLRHKEWNIRRLSNDVMRQLLYGDNYTTAWAAANEDKQFDTKVKEVYHRLLEERTNIYLDNTNLSPKARRYWLTHANIANYATVAVTFDIDVATLLTRRTSRDDKLVPMNAVHQQVAALNPPTEGEFDRVYTINEFIEGL